MNIDGYALVSGDNVLQYWQSIPARIEHGVKPDGTASLRLDGAFSGWTDGTYAVKPYSWTVPDPIPVVPDIISDRQFFQSLALSGTITQAEALAAVKTGTLPAAMQAAVNGMPSDQKFNAEMMLSGATEFDRSNPMTNAMMQLMGWSQADTDQLWRYASTL